MIVCVRWGGGGGYPPADVTEYRYFHLDPRQPNNWTSSPDTKSVSQ